MMALRRSSRRQNIRQRAPGGAGTTTTPEPWQQPTPGRCPAGSGQTASGEAVGVRRCRCAGPGASAGDRPLGNWFNPGTLERRRWWCSHRPPERGGAGGRRRCPPASRAAPASPSAMPSIRPRAAAGAPSVAVSRLGSRAVESRGPVGEEAGRTDARYPGPSQRSRCPVVASLMAAVSPSQPISRHVRADTLCLRWSRCRAAVNEWRQQVRRRSAPATRCRPRRCGD